jgi:transcriptional regulator with XRE-family HTH domain
MTPEELRAARERLGYTQTELAAALELSQGALSQMERGEKPIRRVTALAVEHIVHLELGPKRRKR